MRHYAFSYSYFIIDNKWSIEPTNWIPIDRCNGGTQFVYLLFHGIIVSVNKRVIGTGGIIIIKLVAIDMDETLLRTDKSFDRERFQEIYEEFKKRDIILTIASGNSYARLDEYFSFMNHEELYFASDNGNYIVKNGEVIDRNIINYEELQKAAEYLENLADFTMVFSDGKNTFAKWVNPDYEEYVYSFNRDLGLIDTFDVVKDMDIVKVASHSSLPLDEAKEVAEEIIERFPYLDAVTSGGGWMDFYHIGGGKGTAIKSLQEKYEITSEETMVFGDSLNDASMGEYAKYSVVMSNGDEELKDTYNYEIGSNDDQAVLDILEKFLEDESVDFMEEYKIWFDF